MQTLLVYRGRRRSPRFLASGMPAQSLPKASTVIVQDAPSVWPRRRPAKRPTILTAPLLYGGAVVVSLAAFRPILRSRLRGRPGALRRGLILYAFPAGFGSVVLSTWPDWHWTQTAPSDGADWHSTQTVKIPFM